MCLYQFVQSQECPQFVWKFGFYFSCTVVFSSIITVKLCTLPFKNVIGVAYNIISWLEGETLMQSCNLLSLDHQDLKTLSFKDVFRRKFVTIVQNLSLILLRLVHDKYLPCTVIKYATDLLCTMYSGKLDSNVTLCIGLQSCGKIFSASYLLSLLVSVHNLINICLPAALIDLESNDKKLPKFTEC